MNDARLANPIPSMDILKTFRRAPVMGAAVIGLLATSCATTQIPSPSPSTSVASATASAELSLTDPCIYVSEQSVNASLPGAGEGEAHLSALPGFRACVFFGPSSGNGASVVIDLRQQATAAADVEALLTELFPSDPDVTPLTIQGLPAYYLACPTGVWSPCGPTIAFAFEPYFFVIHVSPPIGTQELVTTLASGVLANLSE
jgi:hypothetical protein